MSTPNNTPTSQKVRKKNKSKKKDKDKSHKEAEVERKGGENEFSEMLLGSSNSTASVVNGTSKKDKPEKQSKKRQRDEAGSEVLSTATPLSQEESPRKKKKDQHEQETPNHGGISSSQSISDLPQKSPHNKKKAHNSSDSLMKQLLKASKKRQSNATTETETDIITEEAPDVDIPSKKDKKDKKSKKRKSDAAVESDDHILRSSPPRRISSPIEAQKNAPATLHTPQKGKPQALQPVSMEALESPFHCVNVSFKVTVPPIALTYPLEGVLAQYISPLLLTYHLQLNGILMSYNNARLSTLPPKSHQQPNEAVPLAQAVDECAAPYIWLTFDALVFRLKEGLEMDGVVNLQNESHISLILWNLFTISIDRKHLPKDWVWHDAYIDNWENNDPSDKPMRRSNENWGVWYDAQGNQIQGALRFRIKDWDCAPAGPNGEGSFLSIDGSMLTPEEDKKLAAEEAEERRRKKEAEDSRRSRRDSSLVSALRRSSTPASTLAVPKSSDSTVASSKKVSKTKKNLG